MPAAKGMREKICIRDGTVLETLNNRRINAGETIKIREMLYSRPENFVAGIFSVLLMGIHLLGVSSLMLG